MITRRRILSKINEKTEGTFVDLGLPSGLKWATGNIIKDDNGNYSMGNEMEYGCHFSWGNVEGYNWEANNFTSSTYASTPGASVDTDISPIDAQHDVAFARLGNPWHLPTKDDFQELYDNTDKEWTIMDEDTGACGWKFMNKNDHSVYIFFRASGYLFEGEIYDQGVFGMYWSSSLDSDDHDRVYWMIFNNSTVYPQNKGTRYMGISVRAVHE